MKGLILDLFGFCSVIRNDEKLILTKDFTDRVF